MQLFQVKMADIAARKTGKLYMHISSCQSTSLETENEKKGEGG